MNTYLKEVRILPGKGGDPFHVEACVCSEVSAFGFTLCREQRLPVALQAKADKKLHRWLDELAEQLGMTMTVEETAVYLHTKALREEA